MGIVCLKEEDIRVLCLPYEGTARRGPSVNQEPFARTPPCPHPHLRTVRNECLLFQPPSLRSLLWWPTLTKIAAHKCYLA